MCGEPLCGGRWEIGVALPADQYCVMMSMEGSNHLQVSDHTCWKIVVWRLARIR